MEFLTSPTLLPVNPDILYTSAVLPCRPLPFVPFTDAAEARRACVSCAEDRFEFCRARDGWALWLMLGAGLLRWISFAAKVPIVGGEPIAGEFVTDALVLPL